MQITTRLVCPSSIHRAPYALVLALAACTGTVELPDDSPSDPASTGGTSSVVTPPVGQGGQGTSPVGQGGSSASGAGDPVAACASPNPGTAPLRRLSNAEYQNTLTDLFAAAPGLSAVIEEAVRAMPAETESLGFRNNAELLTVQSLVAQKYMDAAERIAAAAATAPGILPCEPEAGAELECGKKLVADFGKRAYRRPLTDAERARYEALFEEILTADGFTAAVEAFLYTVLLSPNFLYRVESGEAGGNEAITRPTPYEMASRLSYTFWQSAPDAELLAAAETGELGTPEKIEARARAMLTDPRAERLFRYFEEWLDLDRLEGLSRDPRVFGALPDELAEWQREETRAFVSALLRRNDGSFTELLTAPYTYVNRGLARHYGLPEPSENGFVRVDAPERSGVLTQAMLIAHDKPSRTSIVKRGLKIRTDFLCQNVPAPPNDVALDLEGLGEGLSQRERLELHRTEQGCASCHSRLDPVGLVFESFDAVGRYRTTDEDGNPIDTSGELSFTLDADGPVADARELGARLAGSAEARSCYVKQTFRFFFGRDVEAADACSIAVLEQAFAEKQSLSELLVALTRTDAFLYRPRLEERP
ncbi:MAG: DUF1592 domain-containing protein [Pseudomonadota bacterium]|nr:MAG: hypothetical protein DIU78_11115 [Pseudomonadota bacterium]